MASLDSRKKQKQLSASTSQHGPNPPQQNPVASIEEQEEEIVEDGDFGELNLADDSMEQSSSNLNLDNYNNENRIDDLMEGCSSTFEIPFEIPFQIPSLADSQQMLLQRLKESQKLLKQNSISLPDFSSMFTFAETTVQNIFSKKCFFCEHEFFDFVRTRHYKTKNCKIHNFYTNGWSLQFEEVLKNDDLPNTDTLFDFSEEGPYKVIPLSFFLYKYFRFTWCAMELKFITSNTSGSHHRQ
ncbi:unnamed protein product [Meloidogyne enterolobii]|uniref:Uncharacterized protein n=1 Tax=Meloidogyne enterolobii TaxID=390850 RepID=A0ACB1AW81_MELEN